MANQYELSDSSVVVVIGSGAGGGTVSNELALVELVDRVDPAEMVAPNEALPAAPRD